MHKIDVNFDMRTDSQGLDPDASSPTLKAYHKILWSKDLPNGDDFTLTDQKGYLLAKTSLGYIDLGSDAITHSYGEWKRNHMKELIEQVGVDEIERFRRIGATIGGYTLFPKNKIAGTMTINGARGCNRYINDRFDLTLECIRRHYEGKDSPLENALSAYANFFLLFVDFRGYVDFFMLNDLVCPNYQTINFFLPFDGFTKNPLPKNIIEYNVYKDASINFIINRSSQMVLST